MARATGAAAALALAAQRAQAVRAVVARGGRPDLAGAHVLTAVRSPVLLIVGGLDTEVASLNNLAYAQLDCDKSLEVVPGATHLFEEPGRLDIVARLATRWFLRHLSAA